jgi:hypothetical protein
MCCPWGTMTVQVARMVRWVVDVKGSWDNPSFEISVLRDDNAHGKRSYGWFGENKLLISHDGGPCRDPVTKKVWDKLIRVAHEVADEMNAECSGPIRCPECGCEELTTGPRLGCRRCDWKEAL